MKRFIATMLAIMMLITMMPTSVFAEDTVESTDIPVVSAEPTAIPTTEPMSETFEEDTEEPTTELTREPTTEPTSEVTTASTTEPTSGATTESTIEPISEGGGEPTTESTPDSSTEPIVELMANNSTHSVVELSGFDTTPETIELGTKWQFSGSVTRYSSDVERVTLSFIFPDMFGYTTSLYFGSSDTIELQGFNELYGIYSETGKVGWNFSKPGTYIISLACWTDSEEIKLARKYITVVDNSSETIDLAAPTVEILTDNLTTALSGGGVCLSKISWAKGTVGLEIKSIHSAASGLSQEIDYPEYTCGSNTSIEVETTGISWPGIQTIKARAFAYDKEGQKVYSAWASASTTITGECQHEGQVCTKEVAGEYWELYGIENVEPYYTQSEDGNQHQLHTKCIELCKICCSLLNDNVYVTSEFENHVYENGLCVCGRQETEVSLVPIWEKSRIDIESAESAVYMYYNVDSSVKYVRLDYEGYTIDGKMYESATIGTYKVVKKLFSPVDAAYPYTVIKNGDVDGSLKGFTEGTISKLYLTACDASGNSLSGRSAPFEVYCAIPEEVTETITLKAEPSGEIVEGTTVSFTVESNSSAVTLYIDAFEAGTNNRYTAVEKDMTRNGTTFTAENKFTSAGKKIVWAMTADGTKSKEIEITVIKAEVKLDTPMYTGVTTATVGEPITFTWTAVDNATGYTAYVRPVNNTDNVTNLSGSISGQSVSHTFTEAGSYNLEIYAVGEKGYGASDACNVTIIVTEAEVEDARAPYINPIVSTAGTIIEVGTETTISTKASDDIGLAYIEMFIDGVSAKKIENVGSPEESVEISYTTSFHEAGEHIVVVKAQDVNGKIGEDVTLTITVTEAVVEDTRAPFVNPIVSTAGTIIEVGTETTISTKASDDIGLAYIEMFIDGISVKKIENVGGPEESVEISYTTDDLTVGEHTVMVKAQDVNGKNNEESLTITVTESVIQIPATIATRDVLDEDITSNTVTVTGQITFGTDETAASYDYVGIQYGVYQSEWAATIGTTLNADGSFTAVVTGLNPETTYAFRAVAKNASTQKWLDNSNVVTATTAPDAPVIPTTETLDVNVIEITTEGAILRGKVTDNGGATVTQWGFAWREAGSIDWPTYRFEGTFAENVVEEYELTGLKADTEYEFYFYARNSVGESIHDNQVKTFRTAAEGNTAPSMTASLKVPAESVEANADVYFIFNVENCDKVQLVADGQYGFVIDLLTDTNVKEIGEGKYEWKYAFNKPGENRKIQFVPYNGEVAGVVTEAIILDVTAHLSVSCDTTINPSEWGGDGKVIHVDCNVEWTATTDSPSWITLNANVENDTLNHTYTRNTGYKTREGTITLSAPGCASIVIKVVQKPAPVELTFKARMDGNSRLELSVSTGMLDPSISYTMRIYNANGKKMNDAARKLASGFTSNSWSIGDPASEIGLKLPRAATYTVKVVDSNGQSYTVKVEDSNGKENTSGKVYVPFWNGTMLKSVGTKNGTIANGGRIEWGEDIYVNWDGSYGIHNTVVNLTIGKVGMSITVPSDGPETTIFTADFYRSKIPEGDWIYVGEEVRMEVSVTVVAPDGKSKTSNVWSGTIHNTKSNTGSYRVWYMINEQRDKGQYSSGTITLDKSTIGSYISIYAVDEAGKKWHPSDNNSNYYFEVTGDNGVLNLGKRSYQGKITGAGAVTVTIWDKTTDEIIAQTQVIVKNDYSNCNYSLYADSKYFYPDSNLLFIDEDDLVSIYLLDNTSGSKVHPSNVNDYQIKLTSNVDNSITYRYYQLDYNGKGVGAILQLVDRNNNVVSHIDILGNHLVMPEDYTDGMGEDFGYTTLDNIKDEANAFGLAGEKGFRISDSMKVFDVEYTFVDQTSNTFPNGYYDVTFDVYNDIMVVYGVRALYPDGTQCGDISFISGYTPSISMWKSIYDTYESIKTDIEDGHFGSITGESEQFSAKTTVNIKVPYQGSFEFVQMNESTEVASVNALAFVLEVWSTCDSFKTLAIPLNGAGSCVDIQVLIKAIPKNVLQDIDSIWKKAAAEGGVTVIKEALESDNPDEWVVELRKAIEKTAVTSVADTTEDLIQFAKSPTAYVIFNGADALAQEISAIGHIALASKELTGGDDITIDTVYTPHFED